MHFQKLIVSISLLLCKPLCAQDIAAEANNIRKAAKENPIAISGNFSASSLSYNSQGIAPRRDPFYYVLSANLTLTLLNKVSIPFSAVFTQYNASYTNGLERYAQPFSQFGCSPSYKWLTLHIGYRSLNYSEYTLNGLLFLGAGLELKPKRSIFSVMSSYGRFVHNMVVSNEQTTASFERFGGALKLRAAKNEHFFEITLMQLKDSRSVPQISSKLIEAPKENIVAGISAALPINKHIKASAEYAYSMYSADISEQGIALDNYTYINQIFTNRSSSRYSSAGSAALDYNTSKIGVGAKYKRISADYISLGSPFITNDVEELSGSLRTQLYKNKIHLQGAIGIQQNNLDKKQELQNTRLISSINSNYMANEKINVQLSYSNFSANSRLMRDPFNDSLRVIQINESANTGINYATKSKTNSFNISALLTYQNSKVNSIATRFISQHVNLSQNFIKQELLCSFTLMHGNSESFQGPAIEQWSSTAQIQKAWKNGKYKISVATSYQKQVLAKAALSNCFSNVVDLSYTLSKTASISLQGQFLYRGALQQNVQSFSEQRLSVNYKQSFRMQKKQ